MLTGPGGAFPAQGAPGGYNNVGNNFGGPHAFLPGIQHVVVRGHLIQLFSDLIRSRRKVVKFCVSGHFKLDRFSHLWTCFSAKNDCYLDLFKPVKQL